MVKNLSGKQHPLKEIFSPMFQFNIPYYQRPYAWTEDQSSELFDDLYDFFIQRDENEEDLYFLGSIVLIKRDGKPSADVVDGQQRLTTLTILLALIASELSVLSEDIHSDFGDYIVEKGRVSQKLEAKPRLSLRQDDQDFFRKYVQEMDFNGLFALETNDKEIDTDSKRNIQINSKFLYEKLQSKFNNDPKKILSFGQFIVQHCCLVSISTPDQQSAFRVFSVLNDRGLNLLATDIIKADILGKIESKSLQKEYASKWEYIENQVGRGDFLELFGHIRMIYQQKKAKHTLLKELEEYIKDVESIKFIDEEITPYAYSFKSAKEEDFPERSKTKNLLSWLNRIPNSDWLPPVIYFLSKYNAGTNETEYFMCKLERLAAFLHICGKNVNYRIERYAKIINDLEKKLDIREIPSLELTDEEIEDFRITLGCPIYEYLPAQRRNYLLLRLDYFLADTGAIYDTKKITVEHVLPQNISSGSEWEKYWSKEDLDKWVHRLANLVLLSRQRNSSAQNFDFDVKKQKYFTGRTGVPTYVLTTKVLAMSTWTPSDVETRQTELLSVLYENWEL